jgi:hypothetical protein
LKSVFSFLIISALFFECNNESGTVSENTRDSTKIADSSLTKKQTTDSVNTDNELTGIMNEYTGMYTAPFVKDSSYILEGDTIRLSLKHYCLMDSAIVIPKKYVGVYGLDSFITHNFITVLTVEKNGEKVADKKITKKDFIKYEDASLIEYGVLLYPTIRKQDDAITIDYSISVPLTDVGIGVRAIVKKDGNIEFMRH